MFRTRCGGALPRSPRQRIIGFMSVDDARALLQPAFERFGEGLDTTDVMSAERVLAKLY
jgi:hypothetical protein